jgi:hypothetical protein
MTGVTWLVVMHLSLRNRPKSAASAPRRAAGAPAPGAGVPARTAGALEPASSPAVAGRPTLRDRMSARWWPRRLDRALADGVPPEASPALALRARRLTELARRRSLAGSLRRIVREALDGPRPSHGRIRPDRGGVEAARDELTALADGLTDPRPVAAHAVAQAWLLVTDGTGPLYDPRGRASLRAGAARAANELRPWPA